MSNKLYTSIPAPKVPRNLFNLSRYNSLTMPYQRVCPTAVQEVIPGDKFGWSSEVFCRTAPMVAPVMTDQKISQHAFFVPLRTINKHFAEFMFNNKNGNYSEVLPYVTLGKIYRILVANSSSSATASVRADVVEAIRLCDYMGLPFQYRSATDQATFLANFVADNIAFQNSELRVNIAPFLAYTKVWSEYFRDENLVEDPFETWSGRNFRDVFDMTGNIDAYLVGTVAQYFISCFLRLRPRAWQHDRFTSSLPFAQRGPDVLLPVNGTFSVTQDGPGADGSVIWDQMEGMQVVEDISGDQSDLDLFGTIDGISTTINDFRRAERLQRWYENSARGGVRPNEATLAHFGVRTPDSTLDRAEFLGGSMQPIVISEVAQTSETTQSGTPQGTLAGKGTSYKSGRLFRHFFTEHGFVFVFASALIRPAYWQGIPRIFSRMQRDEYYWPEFALLGEEPVFNKELFVDGSTTEDGVFGYVPRYSDYKSAVPEVHGDFRTSLDFWVNPRKFANQPALNAEFIFGDPQKKQYAVQSDYTDSLLVTIRHNVKASRLMPFYGVPTI